MNFTFEEIEILKVAFTSPDKKACLETLEEMLVNTEEVDLKQKLMSLIKKINQLSDKNIEQLYKDRLEYKISIYPFYTLNLE